MANSRVFYAYTPHPDEELKSYGIFERATVAVRLNLTSEGPMFEYGVSICSKEDNFNKQVGRDLALISLEAGYGKTPFAKHYQDIADYYHEQNSENDGTERATIRFVNDLSNSVFLKLDKHRRKVGEFNKKYKV